MKEVKFVESPNSIDLYQVVPLLGYKYKWSYGAPISRDFFTPVSHLQDHL